MGFFCMVFLSCTRKRKKYTRHCEYGEGVWLQRTASATQNHNQWSDWSQRKTWSIPQSAETIHKYQPPLTLVHLALRGNAVSTWLSRLYLYKSTRKPHSSQKLKQIKMTCLENCVLQWKLANVDCFFVFYLHCYLWYLFNLDLYITWKPLNIR